MKTRAQKECWEYFDHYITFLIRDLKALNLPGKNLIQTSLDKKKLRPLRWYMVSDAKSNFIEGICHCLGFSGWVY